jgi:hypothetical protein
MAEDETREARGPLEQTEERPAAALAETLLDMSRRMMKRDEMPMIHHHKAKLVYLW